MGILGESCATVPDGDGFLWGFSPAGTCTAALGIAPSGRVAANRVAEAWIVHPCRNGGESCASAKWARQDVAHIFPRQLSFERFGHLSAASNMRSSILLRCATSLRCGMRDPKKAKTSGNSQRISVCP